MVEGKTCEVITEINTKLLSSSQEQSIFQWVVQHSHKYLVSIVSAEADEAAVPGFWQVVAITTDLKQKLLQQETTKSSLKEQKNFFN